MKIVNCKLKDGFTLVELLIVISLVGIIAVIVLVLINPLQQYNKAKDARRKHDLELLQKAFEEYYNDTGCYPRAEDICVPSSIENVCRNATKNVSSKKCWICGTDPATPTTLLKYISPIPCDPDSPNKHYLYQAEYPGGYIDQSALRCSVITPPANYCPSWYRLYADFSSIGTGFGDDPESDAIGCMAGGCGIGKNYQPYPTVPYGYDYGVASSNQLLEVSTDFACIDPGGNCTTCTGGYQECLENPNCTKTKIYSSGVSCCTANPSAPNCN